MTSIKFHIFETEQIDFIVFNSPNQNDPSSITLLNNAINTYNICLIFRLCEQLYDANEIYNCKIIDMEIKDGSFPDNIIIEKYLSYITDCIKTNNYNSFKGTKKPCIGIHCRAGLGRAPVFAAIGLMNYNKYDDYVDIVKMIREKIKGAINIVQLTELALYNPIKAKKCNKCIIC